MKILVTGSNGYIGKRIIPILLERGHEVIAMIRMKGITLPKHLSKQVQTIVVDLLDPKSIENIKLVYPMIRSIETWDEDIKQAYIDNTILPCTVPDVEIFNWVEDIINNF